ncbi:MAG: hypothetical protein ACE15D_14570 [Candidatus Eisenbacteria bacterium]
MRSTTLFALVLLVGLTVSDASAGRIFGDIKLDGKPVPAGIPLRIDRLVPSKAAGDTSLAAVPADSTVTDKVGSYKLNVAGEGKCLLTLLYEKHEVSLEVFSYKEATRYDLVLEKKDGVLSLRRK